MATIIKCNNDSCDFKKDIGRRNAVPIIYTRGTHFEIGFDIVS